VSMDTELEAWQREWHLQTGPLPSLKKKILRQNLRTLAAMLAVCLGLTVSGLLAWRHRSPFMVGLAAGMSFASLFLGGYAWWVQRGAWKPTAQTTLAYAELSYRRAVAKARTVRFSFYFVLVATGWLAILMGFDWKGLRARDGIILAGLLLELVYFRRYGQKKKREIEETKKLLDDLTE
jgi:hypothetical protein